MGTYYLPTQLIEVGLGTGHMIVRCYLHLIIVTGIGLNQMKRKQHRPTNEGIVGYLYISSIQLTLAVRPTAHWLP